MKLLLYCTKGKPYLYKHAIGKKEFFASKEYNKLCVYNGKIVAECDYEISKLFPIHETIDDYDYGAYLNDNFIPVSQDACLSTQEIYNYLSDNKESSDKLDSQGYAIRIKNLHIFDEPRELEECEKTNILKIFNSDFDSFVDDNYYELTRVFNAPQNMMKIRDMKDYKYKILISIHPKWMCKILNGEKTVEVRKKVLKEML